ncbi:hypothetical protein [Paludisphaera mucosa]|uniref:Uncharacterized protein n=1 Tax=Paludisphaera mucosa TaxID=3030827 RepID=A0ABT6F5J2_9BACT|nr:hypothetical protein [Paludisphaera mucosa]MDG3002851.1 hypothetical protein [Paludisphaera mucosa]
MKIDGELMLAIASGTSVGVFCGDRRLAAVETRRLMSAVEKAAPRALSHRDGDVLRRVERGAGRRWDPAVEALDDAIADATEVPRPRRPGP